MTDMPIQTTASTENQGPRSVKKTTHTEMPKTSLWLFRLFAAYVRYFTRKQVNALRITRDSHTPNQYSDKPLLIYLNHPGWWDPLTCIVLADHYVHTYKHFAPIDAKAVEKYAFMKRIGFLPLDQKDPGSIKRFMRSTDQILSNQSHALWITAQGKFADPRERPIKLMPGLSRVIKRHPDCVVLPLAIEYTHWSEKYPETFIHFGEPVADRDDLQNTLTHAMTQTMDDLAKRVIARDPAAFQILLDGKRGVGGPYDLWRRFVALLRGQRYNPAHDTETD